MTDAYATSTDIRDDEDEETARLDRQADALLADAPLAGASLAGAPLTGESRAFEDEGRPRVSSLRQAVRDDLQHGRDIARSRAERTRDAIRDEPIKATLYAVAAGVLIGLLMRR